MQHTTIEGFEAQDFGKSTTSHEDFKALKDPSKNPRGL
jgi:hypothetical protein